MLITRTASPAAWPGREPSGTAMPGQDPRAWFDLSACAPAPWPVGVGGPWGPGHAVDAGDLERRFLACLCLPGEGALGP